jgi:RimJ/RimL family protein N-acetyltransferase
MDALDADGVEAGDVPAPHRMTTDRLVLRRAHPDEVEFDRLHALFAGVEDAEAVFELCGWDSHESEADTRAYLDRKAEQWERGEAYEYVMEIPEDDSADSELIGTVILEIAEDDGSGEFGIWLRKPYWGHGFSGEATDALVHVAFECLDAPFVVIGCRPENDRSRRAIEKLVRRYDGAYFGSPPIVPSGGRDEDEGSRNEDATVEPHHEWVITAEQFASGESGLSALVPGVEYADLDF